MSVFRQGTLEKVRLFAYARLSSYLQSYSQQLTIKSLSRDTGISYSTLIGIKNMTLKTITPQRLQYIMDKVGMDYEITLISKAGNQEVRMVIERSVYDPRVENILRPGKPFVAGYASPHWQTR